VVDKLNGEYHVSYTPKAPGTYSLAINLTTFSQAGEGISDSPYEVEVSASRRSSMKSQDDTFAVCLLFP